MTTRSIRLVQLLAGAAALCVLPVLLGCGVQRSAPTSPESLRAGTGGQHAVELRRAIDIQDRASDLLAIPGVVGTGAALDAAGRGKVVVMIERTDVAGVPKSIDGLVVERLVVGPIRPFALDGEYRPLAIGVSVGSAEECLPGTIGCVLERGHKKYVLSANHVLARQNQAAIGEAVVQPSRPDLDPACGPAPSSAAVAQLTDFEPVVYDGRTPNHMDAAIAEITLTPPQIGCATPGGFYGAPSATIAVATDRMAVMKVGRTTELTRGAVKAVNVKVKVTFPSGTALFVGQILTSPGFGAFGDSGALAVTDDGTNRPVGIVIGGSNNGSAILSPIGPILERFGATVCEE